MTGASSHVRIAIIGSGFGGLGAAIRLLQEGVRDFLVFERAHDIGGVWRDNTYPGCACDVQSHLYSFSFARNPSWTRTYSPQAEIHAYLEDCAQRFGVMPHVRLDHAVESAEWDAAAGVWRLATNHGAFTADMVVAAVGGLSEPKVPALPGLDKFRGTQFHSARWNHAYDLAGKRVAIVGTGASAIQFVPAIQPVVASLALFQRTPPWVFPRRDRPISDRTKSLLRASNLAQLAMRGGLYAYRELFALTFVDSHIARYATKLGVQYLKHAIPDPELRAKLTPNYQLGCKRILVSDDYYPAITQPNVTVETSAIAEVTEDAVITAAGTRHEVDAIIFGTGFHVQDFPFARRVRGRDGRTLRETWGTRMAAHLGVAMVNFPNLFLLLGPNTGLGHTSVITMIESQIEHVISALRYMDRHAIATVEPRRSAQDAFVAEVERRTAGTAWVDGGCQSWYLDEHGRNSALWPTFTFTYKRRVERFSPRDYVLTPRADVPVALPPLQRLQAAFGRVLPALPIRVQRMLAGPPIVVDGQTLAPDLQIVVRMIPDLAAFTEPGDLRRHHRMSAVVAAGTRVEVGAVTDLRVDGARARHYAPPGDAPGRAPLLVFFHGGGFVFGDVDTHDRLCRMLARHAGVHVLSVEYRLAPEHPFPAAIEDTARAWRWARQHAATLGADPSLVAVGGDSAGGTLAALVAQSFARTPDAPCAQLLIYPSLDHPGTYPSKQLFGDGFFLTTAAMSWFFTQYVEVTDHARDDIRLRPLHAPDLRDLPPAAIITAGFDPLRDEAEAYAAALTAAGSTAIVRRFSSLIHGFANMTGVSRSSSDAVIEIAGILRTLLRYPARDVAGEHSGGIAQWLRLLGRRQQQPARS